VSPQRLFRQLPVVPRIDQQAPSAHIAWRAAGEVREQLELALGQRDSPIAETDHPVLFIDDESLELPVARVPELLTPLAALQLLLDQADVVIDIPSGHLGERRDAGPDPC